MTLDEYLRKEHLSIDSKSKEEIVSSLQKAKILDKDGKMVVYWEKQ